MIIRPYIFFIILFSNTLLVHAQDNWYSSIKSIQQSFINPAYIPKNNVIVSLPSLHADFGTGGIKFDDFTSTVDGSKVFSLQTLANSINDDITPYLNTNIHTIDLSISFGKGAIYAGHGIHFYANTNVPKGLIDLAAFGNASYIGKTISTNLKSSINAYQNFYVGYAHKIGKLSLGARLNLLNGMYHFKINDSKIDFTTSDDYYRLKLKSKYDFQSAGLFYYDEYNEQFILDDEMISNGIFISKNNGLGIDIGAEYEVSKDIKVFASILQLGSINWKERSNRYINQSEYEFIGFDLKDIIDENIDYSIEDSLEHIFDLEKTNKPFTSALPVKLNAGANYHIGKMDYHLGVQIVGIDQHHSSNVSLSATRELSKFIRLGLSYQIRTSSTSNLGALVDLKFGPVRLFTATQNILTAFDPLRAKSFAFISGLSLEFGNNNKDSKTIIKE